MVGQRELISAFAGVPISDVRGMRAPFLAVRSIITFFGLNTIDVIP
jgi:hypothetical protein